MKLSKRIGLMATAAAMTVGMGLGASPASALSEDETNNFLGQLTATYNDPTEGSDKNPYDFDIVTKAALATGATDILAGLDSFTLFAPNDRAFEVLAKQQGLLGKDYRYSRTIDEGKVFNALVKGLGVEKITEVLLYHVYAGGKATGADVLSGPRYQRLAMANGQSLKVYVLSKRWPLIVLGDKDGRFLNDRVVKSKIDVVETDNTVVHGISDVLLPKL